MLVRSVVDGFEGDFRHEAGGIAPGIEVSARQARAFDCEDSAQQAGLVGVEAADRRLIGGNGLFPDSRLARGLRSWLVDEDGRECGLHARRRRRAMGVSPATGRYDSRDDAWSC